MSRDNLRLLADYVGIEPSKSSHESLEEILENSNLEDFNDLKRILKIVKKQIGRFPRQADLTSLRLGRVNIAIHEYHGGFYEVSVKMGITPSQRKRGFWKDRTNVDTIFNQLVKKLGRAPKYKEVSEYDSSLSHAIDRYHGGFRKFMKDNGFQLSRKNPNFLKDFDNVLNEARKFMKEHGFEELPGVNRIREMGGGTIVMAAVKYHGGMTKLRESLGQKNARVPHGSWKSLDFTIEKAKEIIKNHDLDRLPSTNGLRDIGEGPFLAAVQKYHGGIAKFRKLLGEEHMREENGYWNNESNVIEKAIEVIRENNYDHLPGQQTLQNIGEGSLAFAISRYQGGFPKFRKRLHERFGIELPKRIVKPKKEELQNLWAERTLNQIAKSYEVSVEKVKNWGKEYDLGRKTAPNRVPQRNLPVNFENPGKEELERIHYKDGMTVKEIANQLEISHRSLARIMKNEGIKILTHVDKSKFKKPSKTKLKSMYLREGMTQKDIAKKTRVSVSTVRNWLDTYKIPIRDMSEARLSRRKGKIPSRLELERLYVQKERTTTEIADIFNISDATVSDQLKKYGIESRDRRGIYDDKEVRKEALDDLLKLSGKRPEELSTADFSNVKRSDGKTYAGVLGWYKRNFECKPSEARNILLEDLIGLNPSDNIYFERANKVIHSDFQEWESFKKELEKMLNEHPELKGQIPGHSWLKSNGYGWVQNVASEYHGGMPVVREKLGQRILRKSSHEVRDINYISAELLNIIESHSELKGETPGISWLNENGYSSIGNAISRHHGGMKKFSLVFEEKRNNGQSAINILTEYVSGGKSQNE